jgi:hypothetical protein
VSAPPPDESNVDRDEVSRRDQRDVTPVDPGKKNVFTPMNIAMVAVVAVVAIWIIVTMLS